MNEQKTNLFIVDDHKLFAHGMSSMINGIGHYHVAGIAYHGDHVIHAINDLLQANIQIDIVLLDFEIPGESGVDLVKQIKKVLPLSAVVMMSMHNRSDIIDELYDSGISGYLLKDMTFGELETALDIIRNGKTYFSQDIFDVLMKGTGISKAKKNEIVLTTREREVLELIVKGHTTMEIGDKLFISKYTVESHRKNLLSKLEVHNSAELVKKAYDMELIKRDKARL
jgi:two-component system, NarL family, response regulator NreC